MEAGFDSPWRCMDFQGLIRPVSKKDISDIKDIYAQFYTNPEDLTHFLDRVEEVINHSSDAIKWDFHYFVAEDEGEVVGVIGYRIPPQKLIDFTKTPKPLELYSLFVRNPKLGVGRKLIEKILEEAKKSNYTEMVLYSSDKWKVSWPFYDRMGFERAGILTHTSGSSGQVWRKDITNS